MEDTRIDEIKKEETRETPSSGSAAWDAFLAENGNSHGTVFDTKQTRPAYDKIPEEREMLGRLEEVVSAERPLYPLVFLYDFGQDMKDQITEYPRRKELIEKASVEIGDIRRVYMANGKIEARSIELLMLEGGWLELLKKAYEATGKKNFGEDIRQYMLFRASDSICSNGNADLSQSDLPRLKESYRKTAEILNKRIYYNK